MGDPNFGQHANRAPKPNTNTATAQRSAQRQILKCLAWRDVARLLRERRMLLCMSRSSVQSRCLLDRVGPRKATSSSHTFF